MRAATIFNGTYTISSPNGSHRTFDISTQKDDARFAAGKRLIALLVGPDNTANYKNFGFVTDKGINVYRKLSNPNKPTDFDWFARMVWSLATQGHQSVFYGKGYRLLQSNTCIRCNKKLTTPESVLSGIGPICRLRGARTD